MLLALLLLFVPLANAQWVSTPESREALSLTVYNAGFGIVREVRPMPLEAGRQAVRFEGVASQIEAQTLSLRSLTAPGGVRVREQNYQYDVVGTHSVLNRAIGQAVRLHPPAGSDGEVQTGTLLSTPDQGRIVQLNDGRVLIDPPGTLELLALPPGLVSRPSLLWLLDADRAGTHRTEVSYMTRGLSWEADYVAVLSDAGDRMQLTGYVTLNNQSGMSYTDARLQLMAGDVRRVAPPAPTAVRMMEMPMPPPQADAFQEQSFFEYYLYTLDGTTTLAERESKQLTLLQADQAVIQRRLVFDFGGRWMGRRFGGRATDGTSATVLVEFANTEANRIGRPLPAGTIRLYQADAQGALQFLGEDRIAHTPRGETLRLVVGQAFDVVGNRRVVEETRLGERHEERVIEVEIRNRKRVPETVRVVEPMYGTWEIRSETHPHARLDAQTAQWDLPVPAEATVTLRYTVRIRN